MHCTMKDNTYKINKTDAQILAENEDKRTKCTVYTRVMG